MKSQVALQAMCALGTWSLLPCMCAHKKVSKKAWAVACCMPAVERQLVCQGCLKQLQSTPLHVNAPHHNTPQDVTHLAVVRVGFPPASPILSALEVCNLESSSCCGSTIPEAQWGVGVTQQQGTYVGPPVTHCDGACTLQAHSILSNTYRA
jgi:hypothetical protein